MKTIWKLILGTILLISACKSKDGDYTLFSTSEDLALGEKVAGQIENDPINFPILSENDNKELYQHLNRISGKILQSSKILHREEFAWQLKVIDNDTLYNAFCTPGGYIYVYSGLIKFVQSEDELAGILAHEIAHGDLRHSTDQMTKTYGIKVLTNLILGGESELLTNMGINLLGLKFSRSDEEEADEFAVKYLSDTDYNPRSFAVFFERMEQAGGSMGPLQFLSTHPNPENRVQKIEAFWKEYGSKSGKDHSENFEKLQRSLK
ncbi:MAG: M48 family metalloprotease [Bacteroidetes bacterium]|nr:M48 family metalloprotease [Bacteroidota bacterium]